MPLYLTWSPLGALSTWKMSPGQIVNNIRATAKSAIHLYKIPTIIRSMNSPLHFNIYISGTSSIILCSPCKQVCRLINNVLEATTFFCEVRVEKKSTILLYDIIEITVIGSIKFWWKSCHEKAKAILIYFMFSSVF